MITTDDLNVIEGYVARDEYSGGRIFLHYPNIPHRALRVNTWYNLENINPIRLPVEMFPNLKWEDEPIKVELTIKRI